MRQTEVHKVVDLRSINKVRTFYGLKPLTRKTCQCAACGKPMITFQGELWCNACRYTIKNTFRFESQVVPSRIY